MASEVKLMNFLCWITLIGLTLSAEIQPKLDILPMQSVQKKPVGKSLMLTCRPSVKDSNLITDLRWRDNSNNTIMPKAITEYKPLYDYQGRKLKQKIGANVQSMYTESLQGEQLALIIPSLTESMQGDYYCSAAYANSEMLETKVRIETYVAITWKNAPLNQNPILNSDYTIRCEVTANPSPTVDWLRNGDQIKSAGRYVIGIEGLLIKKVEEADDGVYTCRAAVIPTGELVERNIRVEVQIKPEITSLSSQYEAVEGQEFSVKCTGRGKPVPEFIWVNQDQKEVAAADRFSVNPITGQMSISRVEEQDRGTYTCIARNSAGIAEQRTKLDIVVRPKVYEFINITIPLNSEAAITCKATGRPAPEITFRRWGTKEEFRVGQQDEDDRIILEQNVDDERGESQGTLIISKTIRSDDGLYECVARNKGDAALKVGHITVEYPPNFEHLKGLPPVFSWEERVANLSCFAMGIPNATVEWTWNERKISEMNDKFLQIVNDGIRSDLMVTPVNRRYYSAFKCTARNRLGTSEILMELREARIPGEVVQAKPSEVTATTVTFNIIAPATEIGLPIKAFSVQYKDERNLDWTTARNRTWTPDTPYVVEGLNPQTSYNFRFAARNDVGLGQFGAYVVQSTPPRSAPTPPKILNTFVEEEEGELPIVASTYADHFELIWNRPADNGEPIDFYNIRYCPGGKVAGVWNEIENLCKEHKYIQHSLTNYNMGDLNADTYYRIELSAHNSIGYSTPANLYVKTARGADVIGVEKQSDTKSATIVLIAVAGILVLLIIVDFVCCLTVNVGILATCCRRTKRSPSDLDEEKLGSLYGWHLPYCSGSLIKERSPSPLPLPPPIVKLDPMTPADEDEKQPLNGNGINGAVKKNSTVDFDGRMAHSRSGDIIGKNSSV